MRLHTLLGLFNGVRALRGSHLAIIDENVLDGRVMGEAFLKELNLLLELAEDYIAVLPRVLLENVHDSLRLCRIADPVLTGIALILAALGIDIDLRVDADLAKAQEEFKKHVHVHVLGVHDALELFREDALNAAIEGCLLLRTKGDAMMNNSRRLRKCRKNRIAELLGRTTESVEAHIVGSLLFRNRAIRWKALVDEREECREVHRAIDNRSSRKEPCCLVRNLMEMDILLALVVPNCMSLIADEAVIGSAKEIRIGNELVVVCDIDGTILRLTADEPPLLSRLNFVDSGAGLFKREECLDPLMKNCKRCEDERVLNGRVNHMADGGDCLAETHLIAEKAAAEDRIFLALFHPLDGRSLMPMEHLLTELSNHLVA